uniref:Uncharacterized protein n=1 Tax=Strongyloides stercoralis TaxID=6248 RepID=A0AAF5CXA6_STRER
MSKIVPPPVPAIKPKLENFKFFYTIQSDDVKQKPIPFPRSSISEPLKNKEISSYKNSMNEVIQKLAKFNIYIEFEDITELENTIEIKDYSNNVFDKKSKFYYISNK